MKKVLSVAAVALALSATAVQAHEGFYAGTSYQAANFKVKDAEGKLKAHTLNIVAGYDFNEYLAVEGRFGVPTSKETHNGVDAKPKTSYALFGKGTLPLTDMFSVYAVAGYGKSPFQFEAKGQKLKADKASLQYAAGVEVNFTPQIAMTAEYGMYGYGKKSLPLNLGEVKYDTTGFNLGIKYKF